MQLILYVIFPVFGIMIVGAMAQKFRLLGPGTAMAINQYVTYFALPALLFTSMASVHIHSILNWNFIIAYLIGTVLTFALCFVASKLILRKHLAVTTLQALSSSFSNAAYMGVSMLVFLLGPDSIVPTTVVTILHFLVMVFAIVIINLATDENKKNFQTAMAIVVRSFVKNPIVMSGILGILWSLTGWHLPMPIYKLGHELGITAATCALFAIGKIMMSLKPTIDTKEQVIVCFFKLIVHPLITLPLLFFFQVTAFWSACGLILAALPPATIIYILAQGFHLHEKNCSGILLVSSLISIITITLAVAWTMHIWPQLHYLAH